MNLRLCASVILSFPLTLFSIVIGTQGIPVSNSPCSTIEESNSASTFLLGGAGIEILVPLNFRLTELGLARMARLGIAGLTTMARGFNL